MPSRPFRLVWLYTCCLAGICLASLGTPLAHAGDLSRLLTTPLAQIDPPAPEAPAAPDQPNAEDKANDDASDVAQLRIVVVGLKGLVRVRMSPEADWQKPQVGMAIPQGAQFRTGPRSAVVIKVGATQTITLDRLGTIQVLRAIQENESNTIKTDVGMPYGRTRYNIQAGGQAHESNIRAPSATLAVRGSDVVFQDDAFGAVARGSGRLALVIRDVQRTARAFGEGQPAKIAASRAGSADTAKGDATTDPRGPFVARSPTEDDLTEASPGVGGEDLRALQDLFRKEQRFAASVSIPSNLLATTIFVGIPDFTEVELSILSPSAFAVSSDQPVSPNGRATFFATTPAGLAGPDGSAGNSVGVDLTGLGPTAFTFSLDLRSPDATPVFVPVFTLIESPEGQAGILLNDLANPPIPPSGIMLSPPQPNFTTTVTVPSRQ